uniref:Uncharacterized protein n=1 Tax=Cacopsylla melanoneura TaxID=428564 RepID=A0A8D9EGL5_9HEMI
MPVKVACIIILPQPTLSLSFTDLHYYYLLSYYLGSNFKNRSRPTGTMLVFNLNFPAQPFNLFCKYIIVWNASLHSLDTVSIMGLICPAPTALFIFIPFHCQVDMYYVVPILGTHVC